jgi:hypothetical protein
VTPISATELTADVHPVAANPESRLQHAAATQTGAEATPIGRQAMQSADLKSSSNMMRRKGNKDAGIRNPFVRRKGTLADQYGHE